MTRKKGRTGKPIQPFEITSVECRYAPWGLATFLNGYAIYYDGENF